ncbi:MAG: hypothetical protein JXA36_00170 [Coriobacteriia bacterium]|nr:hypothetical protein [Coriobacteriia bacterium]
MRNKIMALLVLGVLMVSIALPAIAYAGGNQVQYGRPAGDMPFEGDDDRTDGDWGNEDNNS